MSTADAPDPSASKGPLPDSIMGASALTRVALVAAGLSLLWLCVLWAVALP